MQFAMEAAVVDVRCLEQQQLDLHGDTLHGCLIAFDPGRPMISMCIDSSAGPISVR